MSIDELGGRGKSLEEFFGKDIEDLSNRELRKELLLLGNHPSAHPRDDKATWIGDTLGARSEKYKFLVEKCRVRNDTKLNETISKLHDKYLGWGRDEYHLQKTYRTKNIEWDKASINIMGLF